MAWRMGQQADGSDSLAEQVAPQSHWPQLKTLILVVSLLIVVQRPQTQHVCIKYYTCNSISFYQVVAVD